MTKKRFFLLLPSVVVGVFAVVSIVSAATTISTDVVTGGNIYASSTMEVDGLLTLQTAATTTIKALSSSATQGFCLQFNATSTNTILNMTFAASSTAQYTTVGVAAIINYGACR